MLSAPLTTRFDLRAEPSPGLLPRLLQPFAKRDVTPDLFQARRMETEMDITITCDDLEPGVAALIALTRAVRAGHHAGITPDGPKGPALVFKPGAVSLSRLTGRPFLLLGINYGSCHRLRSWDRFALPMPFSRVDVTLVREPMPAEGESDEAVAVRLQARLREVSGDPA